MTSTDDLTHALKQHLGRATNWTALTWRQYLTTLPVAIASSVGGNVLAGVFVDSSLVVLTVGMASMFVGMSGMSWWLQRKRNSAGCS